MRKRVRRRQADCASLCRLASRASRLATAGERGERPGARGAWLASFNKMRLSRSPLQSRRLALFAAALGVSAVAVGCSSSSTSTPAQDTSADASSADTSTNGDGAQVDALAPDADGGGDWRNMGLPCDADYVCCRSLHNDLVEPMRCVNGIAECSAVPSSIVYVPSSECIGPREAGPSPPDASDGG